MKVDVYLTDGAHMRAFATFLNTLASHYDPQPEGVVDLFKTPAPEAQMTFETPAPEAQMVLPFEETTPEEALSVKGRKPRTKKAPEAETVEALPTAEYLANATRILAKRDFESAKKLLDQFRVKRFSELTADRYVEYQQALALL